MKYNKKFYIVPANKYERLKEESNKTNIETNENNNLSSEPHSSSENLSQISDSLEKQPEISSSEQTQTPDSGIESGVNLKSDNPSIENPLGPYSQDFSHISRETKPKQLKKTKNKKTGLKRKIQFPPPGEPIKKFKSESSPSFDKKTNKQNKIKSWQSIK